MWRSNLIELDKEKKISGPNCKFPFVRESLSAVIQGKSREAVCIALIGSHSFIIPFIPALRNAFPLITFSSPLQVNASDFFVFLRVAFSRQAHKLFSNFAPKHDPLAILNSQSDPVGQEMRACVNLQLTPLLERLPHSHNLAWQLSWQAVQRKENFREQDICVLLPYRK